MYHPCTRILRISYVPITNDLKMNYSIFLDIYRYQEDRERDNK